MNMFTALLIFVAMVGLASCDEASNQPAGEQVQVLEDSAAEAKAAAKAAAMAEAEAAKAEEEAAALSEAEAAKAEEEAAALAEAEAAMVEVEKPFVVVRTHFATDRAKTGEPNPSEKFGSKRGPPSFGIADVSIPLNHSIGELETPSLLRMDFHPNPEKHIVLLDVESQSRTDFFDDLAEKIRDNEEVPAIIFVHGFNTTFEDAARRTAQMAYDLDFPSIPIFYSWPSQGTSSPTGYIADATSIIWSEANIKKFLDDFFILSDAQSVFLIAHSMGSRGVTGAVSSLMQEKPELRSRLSELILASPDIDAEIFQRDIAPALTAMQRPITLYASSDDLALIFSGGVRDYPRLGDTGENIVIVDGIETVDASVVSDLSTLISERKRADERPRLVPHQTQDGRYWSFHALEAAD